MGNSGLRTISKKRWRSRGASVRYDHHGPVFNTLKVTFASLALFFCLASQTVAVAQGRDMRILAFGDSLTAGYGLPGADSFPARLESKLRQDGFKVRIQNGGVSGDTTSGGLARIGWLLGDDPKRTPDLVLLELGANDGLRGVDPEITRRNLDAILKQIKGSGARVVLMGMRGLANMGPEYEAAFNGLFPVLAAKWKVGFYPFFLEGVATRPELNLPDGLHPNATGIGVIVAGVSPLVESEYRLWKAAGDAK
jgi:acyl-CoA thioesterase I